MIGKHTEVKILLDEVLSGQSEVQGALRAKGRLTINHWVSADGERPETDHGR